MLELVGKEVEGGGGADGGEEVGERGLQVAQVEGALLGAAALGRVELEGLGLRGGGGGGGGAVAVGAQEAEERLLEGGAQEVAAAGAHVLVHEGGGHGGGPE